MLTAAERALPALFRPAGLILHRLGVPVHRVGYKQLAMAIACFAENDTLSLTKELYPRIARAFGYSDWHPVEHAIRLVILQAWEQRDPALWGLYFPHGNRPPSNKQFIATIAQFL